MPQTDIDSSHSASIDDAQLAHFATMAEDWWNPTGKFRPLHQLNPTRLAVLRDAICQHYERDPKSLRPLAGLRVLDIGCGGGLICEPLAGMGATVVGADALEKNIEIARHHATEVDLKIDYRHTTAEALADAGEKFDVVTNLEVVEHVADIPAFFGACRSLVKDDGIMVVSTLNRTPQSYLAAIVAAEYVLRWLPKGTHDWNRFLKPSELDTILQDAGFRLDALKGLNYSPLTRHWSVGSDLSVNYMGVAAPV